MFNLFTDRARKVITLAHQEAARLKHDYIATCHILLGLTREGSGIAANVLEEMNADLTTVRIAVERLLPSSPDPGDGSSMLPFTPGAKQAIDLAYEEAQELQAGYIGTEHLLLGVLRVEEATAILHLLRLKPDEVRKEVLLLLGVGGTRIESGGPQAPTGRSLTFESFADRTRKALSAARDEARRLNYEYIGTEHLLIGLTLEGEGSASVALAELGVTPEKIRAEMKRLSGQPSKLDQPQTLPFTPRAKRALDWAMKEAELQDSDRVETEHLLLGLLHGDVMSVQILKNMGISPDEVRQKLVERQADAPDGADNMEEDILQALASQYDMPAVSLNEDSIPKEIVQMVSPDIARMYQIVPFSYDDGILTVAMADPRNIHALDDLRSILNLKVEGAAAPPSRIKELIEKFYGRGHEPG